MSTKRGQVHHSPGSRDRLSELAQRAAAMVVMATLRQIANFLTPMRRVLAPQIMHMTGGAQVVEVPQKTRTVGHHAPRRSTIRRRRGARTLLLRSSSA